MGFFSESQPSSMAPQNSQKATARPSLDNEPARPGTSGTEMMLTNNRRRASNRLRDAEKKEREYRNNKRSTTARANFSEAVRQDCLEITALHTQAQALCKPQKSSREEPKIAQVETLLTLCLSCRNLTSSKACTTTGPPSS